MITCRLNVNNIPAIFLDIILFRLIGWQELVSVNQPDLWPLWWPVSWREMIRTRSWWWDVSHCRGNKGKRDIQGVFTAPSSRCLSHRKENTTLSTRAAFCLVRSAFRGALRKGEDLRLSVRTGCFSACVCVCSPPWKAANQQSDEQEVAASRTGSRPTSSQTKSPLVLKHKLQFFTDVSFKWETFHSLYWDWLKNPLLIATISLFDLKLKQFVCI